MGRTRLKVLLVGVFSWGSTDLWKKVALERLGHKVVAFPYRERPVEELFPQGEPFDVVFVSKGVPLSAAQFAHLRTLGKYGLLWWPDPFENWPRETHDAAIEGGWWLAGTSDVVLRRIVTNYNVGLRFSRILEGCDCDGPKPEWTPATIKPALLHFGHLSDRRKAIIERVRAAGVEVDVLEKPVFGAALQREVLSHAAVLSINTSPDLISNRFQTVVAMGGTILQELAEGDTRSGSEILGVIVPHSVAFWREQEGGDMAIENIARRRIEMPSFYRDAFGAERCFAELRWERVMERALAFATGA